MSLSLPLLTWDNLPADFNWQIVIAAMQEAHQRPRPQIRDQFLGVGDKAFVGRSAWIEGLGIGTKSFTVFPDNTAQGRPTVQGAMLIFDDRTGTPRALVDSTLITYWKTAADSVLGAQFLARSDSRTLLVIGTGTVAESLIDAYTSAFARLDRILIWGRSPEKAKALAERQTRNGRSAHAVEDLPGAVASADIVSTATMSKAPILHGDWVQPGAHVDLIGAFKADMREADDTLLQRSRLFVDSVDTTVEHIGELLIPLASGAIKHDDVLGDLYDLAAGQTGREAASDITVYKNGGGAHLDLMTCAALLDAAGLDSAKM